MLDITKWKKIERRLYYANREINFTLSVLTGQEPIRVRECKDSNDFNMSLDVREFINMNFRDYNNTNIFCSISFRIDQFLSFLNHLQKIYDSWFKILKMEENNIPDYNYFKFNPNGNKFIVKNEFKYTRKRFNDTCNNKIIDIIPYTLEEGTTPRVGILFQFNENACSFLGKNDILNLLRMFERVDFLSISTSLVSLGYNIIQNDGLIKKESLEQKEKTNEIDLSAELYKISLIETKDDLIKYCKNNKLQFEDKEFKDNELNILKDAVINYVKELKKGKQ
jgi:hypothetical protein